MTATQIFTRFLKEELTCGEYQFFMHYMLYHGNKYFKNRKFNRKLFHDTFVEDYLSRNNRPLYGFMKRLFILAPNTKRMYFKNPRTRTLKMEWMESHDLTKRYKSKNGAIRRNRFKDRYIVGMYINYYNKKWHDFLEKWVDSDTSPSVREWFGKGKKLEFNFKSICEVYDCN